jgi:hypothetical protein
MLAPPTGCNLWIDNIYVGEGIGFEQPPSAKKPFDPAFDPDDPDNRSRVDALGNVEICDKSNNCTPFFPLGIYSDNYRFSAEKSWNTYAQQGFNTIMWAGSAESVRNAKNAGMRAYFDVSGIIGYTLNHNNVGALHDNLKGVIDAGLIDNVLGYYWDNEHHYEWNVPLAVAGVIRQLDPNHPIFANQGTPGIARRYNNSQAVITDLVGGYLYEDNLLRLDNLEHQQNPLGGTFCLSQGVDRYFRPMLFRGIALGVKAASFFMDCYPTNPLCGETYIRVEKQPWWPDLPNIRREIDQLLPVIRQPHWTSWKLSCGDGCKVNVGTRDYNGEGIVIATTYEASEQTAVFTVTDRGSDLVEVKDYFTGQTVPGARLNATQFQVTVPAYGSTVYVLTWSAQ